MLFDCRAELGAVEHREDLECVGDLHCGSILITVAGDDPAAEPLRGDRKLAAELARAEQHQGRKIHRRGDSGAAEARLDRDERGEMMRSILLVTAAALLVGAAPVKKLLTPNDIVAQA